MKLKYLLSLPLIFILSITIMGQTPEQISIHDYQDPEYCGSCHQQIYTDWQNSIHAQSTKDPIYQRLYDIASKESAGATNLYCSSCHTPTFANSGYINEEQAYPAQNLGHQNISCDFCHTISEIENTHNAQYISKPSNNKHAPSGEGNSPIHDIESSEVHSKSEFCGACHDLSHPAFDTPIISTYTEWKEGPYNRGANNEETIHCQGCHMTPNPQVTESNPAKVTIFGPERKLLASHNIVGANFFLASLNDSEDYTELAKQRLRAAAKLELLETTVDNNFVELKIKVTNIGAGHKLPTGLTQLRQMWLDIKVTDNDGEIIFRSGQLDENNNIDPEAVIYMSKLGNEDGQPTINFWNADRVLKDYRIPPQGHAIEKYSFPLARAEEESLNLEINLRYRSTPQHLINLLWESENEIPIVPDFKMKTIQETISIY